MIRWEYKRLYSTEFDEAELNRLGEDGWELAAIEPGSDELASFYVFKRPYVLAAVDYDGGLGKIYDFQPIRGGVMAI